MIRDIFNGMPADALGTEGWERPWSGPNGGSCVEAKRVDGGRVAVRQSSDPSGPALICTVAAMAGFVEGAKNGLADFLL
ncbi:DUF397 domain-containing protein [Streptomyces liangshanensis]|uniref:DUF397 domain-containing protein n=1 Tax=Streptomyces liangshanensis TaxID=2717324 RepID=A0A6G9H2J9_9ACTN|nr:DUF397 domain-containing protein [Streptomyces liangshanensis]QIQ04763.1 DUF397 domain-containing protein [Streptomyces liangshanensis]